MADSYISGLGNATPAQSTDKLPIERGAGNGYLTVDDVKTYMGLGTAAAKNTGVSAGQVPLLDGAGKLDTSILPSIAIIDTFTVASQAAMLALTAQQGDVAVRSDQNKAYILSTNSPSTLADWILLPTPTDLVLSVAGLTGAISGSALRTALTLVVGTDVQAFNAKLAALAGLTFAADKLPYATGASAMGLADYTAFARTLDAAADAATFRALAGNLVTDPTSVSDIRPQLDLDFTNSSGAPFDDTFTRATVGGYRLNSKGVWVATIAAEPVIDFASDGTPIGTGFYQAYTQLLLNSSTLSTQVVTTTATTYTLSFFGTGSVTLSGTATGSLAGTGANNRVSLTFAATAGSLTLTVSGSVTQASLTATPFVVPYVDAAGAPVARNLDTMVLAGSDFTEFYNQSEGTIYLETYLPVLDATTRQALQIDDGTNNNRVLVLYNGSTGKANGNIQVATVTQAALVSVGSWILGVNRLAMSYKLDTFGMSLNGEVAVTDLSGAVPTVTTVRIGNLSGSATWNAYIRRLSYWPKALSTTQLQRMTA